MLKQETTLDSKFFGKISVLVFRLPIIDFYFVWPDMLIGGNELQKHADWWKFDLKKWQNMVIDSTETSQL